MNAETKTEKTTPTRYTKAEHIADALRIVKGIDGKYAYVQSQTKKGVWYKVTINAETPFCECPDNQVRGNVCKHILAVIIKETGGPVSK